MLVSQVSLWEIAIKYRLGKFPEFNASLKEFIKTITDTGFTLLTLKNEHLISYFNYPHFVEDHKDPFDRLLLVTADVEKAAFITKDEKFDAYKKQVNIVWQKLMLLKGLRLQRRPTIFSFQTSLLQKFVYAIGLIVQDS